MAITDRAYELIQKYILDTLTESEQAEFDELSKDQEFKEELYLQTQILSSFEQIENQKLRDQISQFKEHKTPPKNIKKLQYLIIIALILLIASIYFIGKQNSRSQRNTADIFAELYSPYPALSSQRGQDSTDSLLRIAMSYYVKKEYSNALNAFDQIPQNDTIQLYRGICFIETSDLTNAKASFESISTDNQLLLEAQWYRSLVFINLNMLEEAKSVLQTIVETPNHPYASQAMNALEALQ